MLLWIAKNVCLIKKKKKKKVKLLNTKVKFWNIFLMKNVLIPI